MFGAVASGAMLGASITFTTSPLPGLNVTVTVPAFALVCICVLVTLYWNVIVCAAAPLPTRGVVGTAVNEPSGFSVTVPFVALDATICAVSGNPAGSLALASTPGAPTWICDAMLLAKLALPAVGTDRHLLLVVQAVNVTFAVTGGVPLVD
ncbi:hypothetical protein BCO37747_06899 [Burkholderia contaminans]|nr:hypothetical protein BCO23253_06533 [Burkholderia contaminans]VWD57788.1 hypothetical protein BCO37747_06899 [Burkholderia contaminans]